MSEGTSWLVNASRPRLSSISASPSPCSANPHAASSSASPYFKKPRLNKPNIYGERYRDPDFDKKYSVYIPSSAGPDWAIHVKVLNSADSEGMFCRLCMDHFDGAGGSVPFVTTPCVNKNKAEAYKRHVACDKHQDNLRLEKVKDVTVVLVLKQARPALENLKKQFMIVRFIVQHKLPLIIYPEFISLQKSLHAFASNDVGVYISENTARDMVHCLATACKVQQIQKIRDAPCVGITLDESQDRAVRSQMIVFCKFVHCGSVEEVELGVEELLNGKASTVFAALQNCLKKNQIPLSKVVFLGTDGATVMLGSKKGVSKRLRLLNPECCAMHCALHRHSLVASHSAKNVKEFEKFFDVIEAIARHYSYSATRRNALFRVQKDLGMKCSVLIQACFTRWLTHDPLTLAILQNLPAVLLQLKEDMEDNEKEHSEQALGFFHFLYQRDTIFYLCCVRDILPVLTHFTFMFQGHNVNFEQLEAEIEGLQKQLQAQIESPGACVSAFPVIAQKVESLCPNYTFRTGPPSDCLEAARIHFLLALVENIKSRFPSVAIMKTIVKILQPTSWWRNDADASLVPPKAELEIVLNYYSTTQMKGFSLLDATFDWVAYTRWCKLREEDTELVTYHVEDKDSPDWKPEIGQTPTKKIQFHERLSVAGLCAKFLKADDLVRINPFISRLMTIYLCFTLTTVSCERGFSVMKLLMSPLRACTGEALLDMEVFLCHLSDFSSLSDATYEHAMDLFIAAKDRIFQFGKLSSARQDACSKDLEYPWGQSITENDTELEKQRFEGSAGVNIDVHANTGPSATVTNLRSRAISHVRRLRTERKHFGDETFVQAVQIQTAASGAATPVMIHHVHAAPSPAAGHGAPEDYQQPDGVDIFEVKDIIDISVGKRSGKHVLMYTVWWTGYSKQQSSKEYEEDISPDLIAQWNQSNPGAYRACCEKMAQMHSAAAGTRRKSFNAAINDNDLGLDVRQPDPIITRSGRQSVASNANRA
jgi:hypothetical protein